MAIDWASTTNTLNSLQFLPTLKVTHVVSEIAKQEPSEQSIDQEVDEYVKSQLLAKEEDNKDAVINIQPNKSMRRIEKMWKDRE